MLKKGVVEKKGEEEELFFFRKKNKIKSQHTAFDRCYALFAATDNTSVKYLLHTM